MANPETAAQGAPRGALPLISLLGVCFGAQWGMLGPLVPLYAVHLDYSYTIIGVILSAQGAFQFFLRFAGGVIGDRFGEQNVLRVGFVGMLIGALIFALTTAVWSLVFAQLFIGISRAVYNPAAQSYVTRINEHDRARIIGRFRAAETIGMAVGPPLAGALVVLSSFTAGFLLIAAIDAIGIALVLFLPNIPRRTARSLREAVAPLPAMARSKPMLLAGIVTSGAALGPAAYFTLIAVFLASNGVTVFENGVLTTCFMLAAVGTGLLFGRLMNRLGEVRMSVLTMVGSGFGILLIVSTGSMPLVLLVMPIWGVFHATGNVRTVLTAKYSAPEQRGVAVGYTGSYWALVQFIGPIVLGSLASAIGLQSAILAVAFASIVFGAFMPLLFRLLAPPEPLKAEAEAGTA